MICASMSPHFFSVPRFLFSFCLLSTVICVPTLVAHAQSIGEGYTCSGTEVLNKKSKVIKLAVAKAAVQKKIDALGNSKKDKAKRAILKKVKSDLTACANGKFSSDDGGGSTDVAGFYAGKFTREGAELPGGSCSLPETINASYQVTISGRKITVDPQSNQFHSNLEGLPQVGGFKATDTSVSQFGKTTVTMTVTDLTPTSATVVVVKTFVSRVASKSCTVTVNGSFTRS